MPSCTRNLLAHTHVWPAFLNLLAIAPSTAALTSASSKTMKGALPPSSIDTRLTLPAAMARSFFPIGVDPVKEIFLTSLCVANISPTSGVPVDDVTTLTRPEGTPACLASSASARAVNGVCCAGLITTGHPAASAGATFLVIMAAGKFHGVMSAHTPTPCRITIMRLLGLGVGRSVPSTLLTSSAKNSTNDAAYATSPLASA
mmetsp:Transcript_12646/g.31053  ORF Transcript_12646/g.31053 Transcript_12646/m.31053 type:complete len:202 (+) Transcript_12646:569-1174(+)